MNTAPQKTKLTRMLEAQKRHSWDLERDVDWEVRDTKRPLLPIGSQATSLGLSTVEERTLSQLLGLIATSAISEHERALKIVKKDCWSRPLSRKRKSRELRDLGEQFFLEEEKHSQAFAKYIETFAHDQGLDLRDLQQILPKYEDGFMCKVFRLNSLLGGRAIWWLVMLTEEESLDLFRKMRPHQESIDPLFYQIHDLHFQEEVRHISYAPQMLRLLGGGWLSKFDYRLAELMHFVWILIQLRRLRKVSHLTQKHPFFASVNAIIKKFERLKWKERWNLILNQTPFLSSLFRPLRHKAMRIELKRNGDLPSLLSNFTFIKGQEI